MVDDIVNEKFKDFKEDLIHKKEALKDFTDLLQISVILTPIFNLK